MCSYVQHGLGKRKRCAQFTIHLAYFSFYVSGVFFFLFLFSARQHALQCLLFCFVSLNVSHVKNKIYVLETRLIFGMKFELAAHTTCIHRKRQEKHISLFLVCFEKGIQHWLARLFACLSLFSSLRFSLCLVVVVADCRSCMSIIATSNAKGLKTQIRALISCMAHAIAENLLYFLTANKTAQSDREKKRLIFINFFL